MYALSDLVLLIDHLWPGDTAEAQFARTAVNFLVEAGTKDYHLSSGVSCLVAVPVRLYKVVDRRVTLSTIIHRRDDHR